MLCPIVCHKLVALRPTPCGLQYRRTLKIMPFRLCFMNGTASQSHLMDGLPTPLPVHYPILSFLYLPLCFSVLSSLCSGSPLLHFFICLCSSHDFLFNHIFFRVLNNPWMAFSRAIFCHPSYGLLTQYPGFLFPHSFLWWVEQFPCYLGFLNHFVSLWFPAPLTVIVK